MSRKFGIISLLGVALMLTAVGCKSTWTMKNPFSSKPEAHIASPAEMDELQLKAPPESYTRGELPGKQHGSKESLAQNGAYQPQNTPGFAAPNASAATINANTAPGTALPTAGSSAPIQTAMTPQAVNVIPTGSQQGVYANTAAPQTIMPQTLAPLTASPTSAAGTSLEYTAPTSTNGAAAGTAAEPVSAFPTYGGLPSYGTTQATTQSAAQPAAGTTGGAAVFAPGSIGGY